MLWGMVNSPRQTFLGQNKSFDLNSGKKGIISEVVSTMTGIYGWMTGIYGRMLSTRYNCNYSRKHKTQHHHAKTPNKWWQKFSDSRKLSQTDFFFPSNKRLRPREEKKICVVCPLRVIHHSQPSCLFETWVQIYSFVTLGSIGACEQPISLSWRRLFFYFIMTTGIVGYALWKSLHSTSKPSKLLFQTWRISFL